MTDTAMNFTDDMTPEQQQEFKERLKAELALIDFEMSIPEGTSYAAIITALGSMVTATVVEVIEPGHMAAFIEKLFDFVCYSLDRRIGEQLEADANEQAYENNAPNNERLEDAGYETHNQQGFYQSNVNAPDDVLDAAAHGFDDAAVESTGL